MKIKSVFIAVMTALILSSCTENRVYDRYQHTPVVGWERNDTLKFDDIARFKDAGCYTANLGLRINGYYPFTGLTLIIDKLTLPSHAVESDTINCNITVMKGDSIIVSVRHNMKREILPGISDIGYMLIKKD